MTDIENYMLQLGRQAREASRQIAKASTAQKNAALLAVAEAVDSSREQLMLANEQDMQAGRGKGLDAALLDRLELNAARIDTMIEGLRQVAALDDPVGAISDLKYRPSGIPVGKMRGPLSGIGSISASTARLG